MPDGATGRAATVEFEHVTKHYDRRELKRGAPGAVNDLSFAVPAGRICVLVGPSGCGKTTSLKMVNRLIEPTSGRILLDGVDAAGRDLTELRRGIGYVIQQTGLFPHQTIDENVATVPRLLGWPAARRRERAEELLALVGLDPATYAGALPRPALGRRAAARRRRPGAGGRPADHAHGRAVRGRRPDRPGAPAGRVPAPPGDDRQDDPLRDPRHRRGDQDGRPRGRPRRRRRPRPVRAARRDPRQPGIRFRGPLRRRRPRPQAAEPEPGGRSRPAGPRHGAARRAGHRGAAARPGSIVPLAAPRRRPRPAGRLGRPRARPPGRAARRGAVHTGRAPPRPAGDAQGRPQHPPRRRRPRRDRRRPVAGACWAS